MIIAEELFIPLFETLPFVTVNNSNYKPQYDFGSHEDLLRYLKSKAKEGGKVYPLIWLETPITLKGDRMKRSKFKFIIATLTKSEMSNRERLGITINPTLKPLLSNIIKALNQSGFTFLLNRDNEQVAIYYNYGVKENKENYATDIWDAITFECELEITTTSKKLQINY